MGHDKLRKFAENETFSCLLQPSAMEVLAAGFDNLCDNAIKGRWNDRQFSSPGAPIILELGCGKGEYTLALARRNPDKNYIGVDIKGARLWRGAKTATQEGLRNVAFLRTRVEFITAFFAPGEVSEIWLTFSDPQPKSENNRLSSPLFLERYRSILRPGGIIHLKTDSLFLHDYTLSIVKANGFNLLADTTNLYFSEKSARDGSASEVSGNIPPEVREVHTFYENMFLKQGVPITYMAFAIDREGPLVYSPEKYDAGRWRLLDSSRRSFKHKVGE